MIIGSHVERGHHLLKFSNQSGLGYWILIVNYEHQRVVSLATNDVLLSEIESTVGFDQARTLLEDEKVVTRTSNQGVCPAPVHDRCAPVNTAGDNVCTGRIVFKYVYAIPTL